MTVYSSTHTKSVRQVNQLAKLYENGQVSDLTAQTLSKLLDLEISETRLDLEATEKDLAEFEKQYGMPSAEFYQKYQSGQTDDRMDYVEWASLAQMEARLRERLELLTSESKA